ncbi:MAG: SHOCT domain-containing protein [Firmicutes bacterium]|nr:SHOCT domain-containing protein [Bacillota bacterium]
MWGWGHAYGPGFGFGGLAAMFMMFVFWALVIGGIVLAIRYLSGQNRNVLTQVSATHSALDILKERYARGEIDKEEYETKKKDLMS